MRERTNGLYVFRPNGWDRFDPKATIEVGAVVRVIRLPSAPPPNTMGQAYVADPATGEFLGMVSTGSLSLRVKA